MANHNHTSNSSHLFLYDAGADKKKKQTLLPKDTLRAISALEIYPDSIYPQIMAHAMIYY